MRLGAILMAALLAGCVDGGGFVCEEDRDCGYDDARCEASGRCSFADESCGSGRRYGDEAGELSGVCVGDDAGAAQ